MSISEHTLLQRNYHDPNVRNSDFEVKVGGGVVTFARSSKKSRTVLGE